ncbi:MAG: hypothetical protein ACKVQW_10040 [Pyrinomonadaceae bacterium]
MVADNDKRDRKYLYRAGYIGVFFAFVWTVLMFYWGANAPLEPNEIEGRIYPYNYHGTIVYLNFFEQFLKFALPSAGVLTFAILVFVERYLKKKNKKWPPDDIYEDLS